MLLIFTQESLVVIINILDDFRFIDLFFNNNMNISKNRFKKLLVK